MHSEAPMPNVVSLRQFQRRDCTGAPPAKTTIDEIRSLSTNWRSISANFERLQVYLDDLRPILDTLPEGAEKSYVGLLISAVESQIRDSLVRAVDAGAAVERLEAPRSGE
jgi:hypothetical protein